MKFYGLSCMLHLSEFVWTLRYSVLVVFNNFLLIDATERSKISSDQKRFFIALSLYPLSFFANTPFKPGRVCILPVLVIPTWGVETLHSNEKNFDSDISKDCVVGLRGSERGVTTCPVLSRTLSQSNNNQSLIFIFTTIIQYLSNYFLHIYPSFRIFKYMFVNRSVFLLSIFLNRPILSFLQPDPKVTALKCN